MQFRPPMVAKRENGKRGFLSAWRISYFQMVNESAVSSLRMESHP